MDRDKKHIEDKSQLWKDSDDFFTKAGIEYNTGKEEIWKNILPKLDHRTANRKIIKSHRTFIRVAALFIALVSISLFFRFYTKTIECPKGSHITALLPDSSIVELNAQSSIKYKPLWWTFSRKIKFEGEGFFKVTKGEKFKLSSKFGETIVLGTSFNIFSRDNKYEVTCFSGRVKVVSLTKQSAIIGPNEQAEIDKSGRIEVFKNIKPDISISWINNMFLFTSVPVVEVIKEIERQYNIIINTDNNIDLYYTGFFSKNKSLEEVLDLLSKPFDISFVKSSDNEYRLIQN